MCWNAEVSLNTFVFSTFMLLFIIYNNKYTQYKIPILDNFWTYMFFVSFITMQLIEFFIWKNINNPFYNSFFSSLAALLLMIHPVVSLMMLNNAKLKQIMIGIYLAFTIPFSIYRFSTKHIFSKVSQKGHLSWFFLLDNENILERVVLLSLWLFFFLFSLFYNQNYFGFVFGVLTLLFVIYNYARDGSIESMWCWIVNTIMIFYSIYLLIYLPFFNKK